MEVKDEGFEDLKKKKKQSVHFRLKAVCLFIPTVLGGVEIWSLLTEDHDAHPSLLGKAG